MVAYVGRRLRGQFLKTTDRGVKSLVKPGHEIAGTKAAISDESDNLFAKGDRFLFIPGLERARILPVE